jgi:threonine/homoserine/homoserine lactone efflux protein
MALRMQVDINMHNPLLAIAVIWFFAAVSPGPNFFITVRTSFTQPRALTIRTVSGIATGTAIWALAGSTSR